MPKGCAEWGHGKRKVSLPNINSLTITQLHNHTENGVFRPTMSVVENKRVVLHVVCWHYSKLLLPGKELFTLILLCCSVFYGNIH